MTRLSLRDILWPWCRIARLYAELQRVQIDLKRARADALKAYEAMRVAQRALAERLSEHGQ
jgi:hypothetical protein